jgi:hypothetical protein
VALCAAAAVEPAADGSRSDLRPLLQASDNRLSALPAGVGQLTQLVTLRVRQSSFARGRLTVLQVSRNQLKWLPAGLDQLTRLEYLFVRPPSRRSIDLFGSHSLPSCRQLDENPLPTVAGLPFEDDWVSAEECARRANEIIAATTHIGMIRERATEICIGLQDLELPAFVTLQIIDEAVHVHENSIRMWAKWELITAVKHFRT